MTNIIVFPSMISSLQKVHRDVIMPKIQTVHPRHRGYLIRQTQVPVTPDAQVRDRDPYHVSYTAQGAYLTAQVEGTYPSTATIDGNLNEDLRISPQLMTSLLRDIEARPIAFWQMIIDDITRDASLLQTIHFADVWYGTTVPGFKYTHEKMYTYPASSAYLHVDESTFTGLALRDIISRDQIPEQARTRANVKQLLSVAPRKATMHHCEDSRGEILAATWSKVQNSFTTETKLACRI